MKKKGWNANVPLWLSFDIPGCIWCIPTKNSTNLPYHRYPPGLAQTGTGLLRGEMSSLLNIFNVSQHLLRMLPVNSAWARSSTHPIRQWRRWCFCTKHNSLGAGEGGLGGLGEVGGGSGVGGRLGEIGGGSGVYGGLGEAVGGLECRPGVKVLRNPLHMVSTLELHCVQCSVVHPVVQLYLERKTILNPFLDPNLVSSGQVVFGSPLIVQTIKNSTIQEFSI